MLPWLLQTLLRCCLVLPGCDQCCVKHKWHRHRAAQVVSGLVECCIKHMPHAERHLQADGLTFWCATAAHVQLLMQFLTAGQAGQQPA